MGEMIFSTAISSWLFSCNRSCLLFIYILFIVLIFDKPSLMTGISNVWFKVLAFCAVYELPKLILTWRLVVCGKMLNLC